MTPPNASESETQAFVRYLRAKASVDDRALNKDVILALRHALEARKAERISVLEVGGGLGTMLARLLEWQLLTQADYRIVELDAGLIAQAPDFLAAWAEPRGYTLSRASDGLTLRGSGVDVSVCFEQRDVSVRTPPIAPGRHDLLIANAVLDLLDVPTALPALFSELKPGGWFWLTLNFDGETVFLPEHAADRALLDVYHRSMDERVRDGCPAGDSKTGRRLFSHIPAAGGAIVAAGASDWIVRAEGGSYPDGELGFLEHILATAEAELRRHAAVDSVALEDWCATRRAQAQAGELVYLAKQYDFVGQVPG